jgi:hypothetical protein
MFFYQLFYTAATKKLTKVIILFFYEKHFKEKYDYRKEKNQDVMCEWNV